jgi:Ni/Co efflux regulator RcnB
MGKRLLAVFAVALLVGTVVLLGLSGAAQEVPEKMVIKSELWKEHTKAGVEFSHKKHAEDYNIKCNECHHVYKDGKNVWKEGDEVQKCMACHTEPTIQGEKRLPEAQQKLNLKLAFHNNCTGCHRDLKRKDREKYADIPTTCLNCHPKEE